MSKKKATDLATAVPKPGMVTTAQKIQGARDQLTAFKNSPGAAGVPPAVTQAAADWSKATDDLEANNQQIPPAEAQLQVLRNNEPVLARRWGTKKRAFFSAVNVYADGSKDKVTGVACNVLDSQPLPLPGVPQNLRDTHSKVRGVASAAWTIVRRREYLLQHCTNPADATTYADPVFVSRAKYKLEGQTPGVTLYVRVLVLDAKLPNGKSDYTPWVAVIVGV